MNSPTRRPGNHDADHGPAGTGRSDSSRPGGRDPARAERGVPDADDSTPGDPTPLELAWTTHIDDSTELLDRLVSRHRERQRRYHRIDHVEAVVTHAIELADTEAVVDLAAVVAAAFWHDAIYEPQHPANERASARLAARDLTALGWSSDRSANVSTMIEGTATHVDPPDADTAVLFDADLAILGAEPDVYARYSTAVRAEYSHVDDTEWRVGRAAVLRAFIDRPSIFATPTARERWETVARTNLAGELAILQP